MPSYKPVHYVEKTLRILELVGSSKDGVPLSLLRDTLGLAPPAVADFLKTMVAMGFLEKSKDHTTYRLGPHVSLFQRYQRDRQLTKKVQPILLDIYRQVGPQSTIALNQCVAGEVLTIVHVTHREPGIIRYPIAWINDPYMTASSLAYLAFCDPNDRRQYVCAHLLEKHAPGWVSMWNLYRFLIQAHRIGCIVLHSADDLHFTVAAPIWDSTNRLLAVLSVGLPHALATTEIKELCIELACQGAVQLSANNQKQSPAKQNHCGRTPPNFGCAPGGVLYRPQIDLTGLPV